MEEFIQKIISLDNIKQWEERDSVIKESVSQHSFKVSAICIYLLEMIVEFNKKLNESQRWKSFAYKCVKYAVLHDFDESIIGRDISHEVKYNTFNGEKIREQLDAFVNNQLRKNNLIFLFEKDRGEEFINVKEFVKMCDWFALQTFVNRNKKVIQASVFEKEEKYCSQKISESVKGVIFMLKYIFDNQLNLHFLEKYCNND